MASHLDRTVLFEMSRSPHAGIAWGTLALSPSFDAARPQRSQLKPRFTFGGFVRGLAEGHASYPYVVAFGGRCVTQCSHDHVAITGAPAALSRYHVVAGTTCSRWLRALS